MGTKHKRFLNIEKKQKGSKNNIKTGMGTKHKRLLNTEKKQRVAGGFVRERMGSLAKGHKESTPEIICCTTW